jgi:hypothetical protein
LRRKKNEEIEIHFRREGRKDSLKKKEQSKREKDEYRRECRRKKSERRRLNHMED